MPSNANHIEKNDLNLEFVVYHRRLLWKKNESRAKYSSRNHSKKEFLEELHISARTLSIETGIPESNMSQILKGKRNITAHISLRLGKFFQLNEEYFLTIQNHYDLTKEKIENWEKLSKIRPYHKLQKST